MKHLIFLVLLVSSSFAKTPDGITFEEIEKQLKGPGLVGEVHGSVAGWEQFVFTVRDPQNFFEHWEFPMVTDNPAVKAELKKLRRHDKVKVRGSYLESKAPIRHIEVDEITMVKKFEDGMKQGPYQHEAKLPEDLKGKTELVGKVHAIAEDGKVLVIEYKDAVIPVFTKDNSLTKSLYRNDKIKMKYELRQHPGSPSHVTLSTKEKDYLIVTDRMVASHGKAGTIEGNLIMFPKSPQVIFNVFAVQDIDGNSVKREYTLVNFDDPKVFEKIREKLQEVWDKNSGNIKNARNKYVNLNVRVKATGTFNVVDAGQANPQILLTGPEAITVLK